MWLRACVKIIKLQHAFDISVAFRLNYFHFGNSCLFLQFTLRKVIRQMLVDSRSTNIKQGCHCFFGSPNGLVLV